MTGWLPILAIAGATWAALMIADWFARRDLARMRREHEERWPGHCFDCCLARHTNSEAPVHKCIARPGDVVPAATEGVPAVRMLTCDTTDGWEDG